MTEIGNKRALRHGGESGVKALAANRPLPEPAAAAQLSVRDDYAAGGAAAMILEQAERIHAVSRLYFDAFLAAIQAGDLVKADGYASRFGWLANSSRLAWETVLKGSRGKGNQQTLEAVLHSYQAQKDGTETPQDAQGEAQEAQGVQNDQGAKVKDE